MYKKKLPKCLQDIEIQNPVLNSTQIIPGCAFVAVKGSKIDGRSFIKDACKKGASLIIYQKNTAWNNKIKQTSNQYAGVTFIPLENNPRDYLVSLANKAYPSLPKNIIAITGTNGKTSTASFAYQILKIFSIPTAYLGTNGFETSSPIKKYKNPIPSLTTPDIFSLYKILSFCKKEKIDHVFIEASSHGLYQGRLDGLYFSAGCFTNLSPEHLDFHKNENAYFEAKKLLFTKHMLPKSVAVINTDDPLSDNLIKTCLSKNITVKTFGKNKKNTVFINSCTASSNGLSISFIHDATRYSIKTCFFGSFQAWNLAGALLLATSVSYVPFKDAIKKIPSLCTPTGRMDFLGTTPNGATVFVDFAHTPDALEKALSSLQAHTKNNLWVVFGCGGDRDAQKRPLMGKVSQRLANISIITDDNPRTEEPDAIREAIADSCEGAIIIEDRGQAIQYALTHAQRGDSILIAGKGHETGQIIGTKKIPYSDHSTVKKVLESLAHA